MLYVREPSSDGRRGAPIGAIAVHRSGDVIGVGWSIHNPNDVYDKARGREIAVGRARKQKQNLYLRAAHDRESNFIQAMERLLEFHKDLARPLGFPLRFVRAMNDALDHLRTLRQSRIDDISIAIADEGFLPAPELRLEEPLMLPELDF